MLTTDSNVKRYAIVASITEYTFNFPFWDMPEISVTVSNTSTGASETLEKDVDYTLTVAESIAATVFNGGTVTMISDKYKGYNALVIMRSLPFAQETHIPNSEPINGEVLEMTLDKMVAQSQQLNEDMGHALKLPDTDAPGDYRIPEAAERGGKALGFTEDGKGLTMYDAPDKTLEQAEAALAAAQRAQAVTEKKAEQAIDAAASAEADRNRVEQLAETFDTERIDDDLKDLEAGMFLPIPHADVSISEGGDNAVLALRNNWTGYGDVTVRIKAGGDPADTDTAVTGETYAIVANGEYHLRAFPPEAETDADTHTAPFLPGASLVLDITALKVQKPVFSYDYQTHTVTLTCGTSDAEIRYTLDGSQPTATTGTVYTGPFTVTETKKVLAEAFKTGIQSSDTVSGDAVVARIIGVRTGSYGGIACTRLTPETDPLGLVTETISTEPVAEITGTQTGQSVFDSYGPWQLRMRNFEADGTPGAWQDEEGFTLTGKDVMVHLPACWIKQVGIGDGGNIAMYISDGPYPGFTEAPWSDEYIARYETSNNNQSRSGVAPQASQTIVAMRTNARAKGEGWQILDLVAHSGLQWLYLIEYANKDSQAKVGRGYVDVNSAAINTGSTDAMTFHTGRPAGTDGKTGVQYRYVENPWGNLWEWCDGFNTLQGKHYVCADREMYASDNIEGYTEIASGSFSGYWGIPIIDSRFLWMIGVPAPTETTYTTTTGFCDSGYLSGNGQTISRVLRVGGHWNDGDAAGLFCFNANYASSGSSSVFGSRLTYKEAA